MNPKDIVDLLDEMRAKAWAQGYRQGYEEGAAETANRTTRERPPKDGGEKVG